MMINKINPSAIIDALYALASLRNFVDNPALPGPLGRDDEDSLHALVLHSFGELCSDLGAEASGDSVELPADVHSLLQAALTDRVLAALADRPPRPELLRRLRCRLRPLPPKTASRY